MIDERAARQIAESHAPTFGKGFVVDDEFTKEHTFGWVFLCIPGADSGIDPSEIYGGGPFIVDRHDGSIHLLGTREPYEELVER